MPQATFWFASPFREWVGHKAVTLRWEGRITLREALERFAADHPRFRENVSPAGTQQEAFDRIAAVIVAGDFLALDSAIPEGSTVDVLTPLAGGARGGGCRRSGGGSSR